MKRNHLLPGYLLTAFGLYLLLQQLNMELWSGFFSWTTFLLIIGLGITIQAYKSSDHASILPGIAMLGIGLHFQLKNRLTFWPDDYAMIIFLIAIAFLLSWQKTKQGFLEGLVLLIVASFFLFSDSFFTLLNMFEKGFSFIYSFWPLLFIIIGIYLLFFKRK